MVAGIVVTHGNLGKELLQTARMVFGDFSDCYPLSNASKSTDTLSKEIGSLVEGIDGASCIIFVDFLGGSCGHACLSRASVSGNERKMHIITGVNLPMILAFLNKRDEVSFEELPALILERSRDSIRVLDPSKI
jgi:mannose/fructose-specific phosphotransferase system component IIA